MTDLGGSAPEGAPQTQSPQPWPPEQIGQPSWSLPPSGPPQWLAQQGVAPWPQQPARRDSTRTMAVVALVLSGIALFGMAMTTIGPLLAFGLFASVAGEGFDEGTMFPSVGTSYGGAVTPAADGSVTGPALAAAVTELMENDFGDELGLQLSCDPVPHVEGGVSALCRADNPTWYGIVRFTNGGGSFQVITVSPDGESFP
jgi:hypothetical protein